MKFAGNFAHEAGKIAGTGDGENAEAGADLRGAEVDGADGPGLGQHIRKRGTERRGSGVAGLQFVETAGEVAGEARFIDAKLFEDAGEIAIGDVKKLEEEVLDLDVIVSASEAEARRGLESIASGIVQFADQTL